MESLGFKLKNPGDPYSFPPTLVLTDLINFGSEIQQHIAFYATLVYYSENGDSKLPLPNNVNDANQVLTIAKRLLSDGSINLENFELDEQLILRYVVIVIEVVLLLLLLCYCWCLINTAIVNGCVLNYTVTLYTF